MRSPEDHRGGGRRPPPATRVRLAWHGLGLTLRRLLLGGTVNEKVDVVKLCEDIRDPDNPDSERRAAALELIDSTGLRSLKDVLAVVWGADPHPSPGGFDACSDAWEIRCAKGPLVTS